MADQSFVSGSSTSLIPSERMEDIINMLVAAGVEPKEVVAHNFPTSVKWDFIGGRVARTIYEQNVRSVVCITKHVSWYDLALCKTVKGFHGVGSGFIWDRPERFIVTNYHVIEDASVIEVGLYKGETKYSADIVAYDVKLDIAVLSINAPKDFLTPIEIGVSADLEVGSNVYAISHRFTCPHVCTMGMISGIDGTNGDIFSQIAIHEGNSGGPLLDEDGNLIGIHTAIVNDPEKSGLARVIPVDTVSRFLEARFPRFPKPTKKLTR